MSSGRRSGIVAIAAAGVFGILAVTLALHGGTANQATGGGLPAKNIGVATPLPGQVFPSEVCPTPTAAGAPWPVASLAAVPKVPGAVMGKVERGGETLTVEFTVATNYLTVGGQVRTSLPSAGLLIVGGDQEPKEIDTRFLGGDLTGGIKVIATGSCTSLGILAVLDPTATGAPESPLPASLLPTAQGLPFASAGAATP